MDAEAVKAVLGEYRALNADVYFGDDYEIDDLVDVVEGGRIYIPALYVVNKIDQISLEELEVMDRLVSFLCWFSIVRAPNASPKTPTNQQKTPPPQINHTNQPNT